MLNELNALTYIQANQFCLERFGKNGRAYLMNNFPLNFPPIIGPSLAGSKRLWLPEEYWNKPFGEFAKSIGMSDLKKNQTPYEFYFILDEITEQKGLTFQIYDIQNRLLSYENDEQYRQLMLEFYELSEPVFIEMLNRGYNIYPDLSI